MTEPASPASPESWASPASSAAGLSRRRLLAVAAGGAGAGALAAGCHAHASHPDPDLDVAARGLTLEGYLASTYETLRALLTEAKLGAEDPDAVITFVITAADHHHKTAEAWTSLLHAGGRRSGAPQQVALRKAVDFEVTRLTDVIAASTLAMRLEDFATQTYQAAIAGLRRPDVIKVAAQATVVGAQRQATLRFIVGLDPVGSGTASTTDPATTAFAPAAPAVALVTG